jgi:hypothetical protein
MPIRKIQAMQPIKKSSIVGVTRLLLISSGKIRINNRPNIGKETVKPIIAAIHDMRDKMIAHKIDTAMVKNMTNRIRLGSVEYMAENVFSLLFSINFSFFNEQ